MLPWILVSQVLEPSKACIPAWDLPYLQQQASILVESKPLVGLTSPGPTSAPIHVGGRARCPEHPNAKNPVRQLAPSSKVPYQDPPSDPIPKERHPSAIQKSSAQHSLSQFSSKHLSCLPHTTISAARLLQADPPGRPPHGAFSAKFSALVL